VITAADYERSNKEVLFFTGLKSFAQEVGWQ
jgi:hypothetical protein